MRIIGPLHVPDCTSARCHAKLVGPTGPPDDAIFRRSGFQGARARAAAALRQVPALIEPHLAEGALLIVDDTDWAQVARAMRAYLTGQPRAELLVRLDGKDRGQPWWWEGVQVLRWR